MANSPLHTAVLVVSYYTNGRSSLEYSSRVGYDFTRATSSTGPNYQLLMGQRHTKSCDGWVHAAIDLQWKLTPPPPNHPVLPAPPRRDLEISLDLRSPQSASGDIPFGKTPTPRNRGSYFCTPASIPSEGRAETVQ